MVLLLEFYSHSPGIWRLAHWAPFSGFPTGNINKNHQLQVYGDLLLTLLIVIFSYITNNLYPPKKLIRSILIMVSYTYDITSKLISPPSELQPEVPCIQQSLAPPASAYPSGRGSYPPQLLAAAVRPPGDQDAGTIHQSYGQLCHWWVIISITY